MKLRTATQFENAVAFTEELPADDTLSRMEELFHQRRGVMITANNRRIRLEAFDERFAGERWQISDGRLRLSNEFTQAEMKRREIEAEIVEVARLIVAEANNSELATAAAQEALTV
jgi:hypothetical protein